MTKDSRQPNPDAGPQGPSKADRKRKPYSKPALEFHGDLRITLAGASPGAFDSQFPNTRP